MGSFPVSQLKNNTYFSAPVYLDGDYILLSPDIPVTEPLVRRLRKWKFNEVRTDGEPVDKPAMQRAEPGEFEASTIDEDIDEGTVQKEFASIYFNLLTFTENVFNSYQDGNPLDIAVISQKIKELIDAVKRDRDVLISFPNLRHPVNNYIITHSANTAIFSLAIGDFLKLPPHRMIELGLAAFIHDIGMMKIPSSVYLSSRELTDKERQLVLTHPVLGYRILKSFSVHENIALGVMEHQERVDGTGYPRGIKGDSITLYARIIAVACSYEAIISSRPFRPARDGHTAMLDLLKTNRSAYDETVLKALVYCLSLYPIGSHVLLSNGSKGVVYKSSGNHPRYPAVRLIRDPKGQKIGEKMLVQTSKENNLEITRVMSADEIKDL